MAETEKEKKSIHAGHRQRVKEQYEKAGLDHFPQHNVLEMLLFFAIPQRDTNPIAHRLIEEFGSFSQVFKADIERLAAIPGMTRNAAILLHLVPDIYRRIAQDELDQEWILNNDQLVAQFLTRQFYGRSNEIVLLLCMNNSCRLLRSEVLSEGGLSAADVSVRKLCEVAFLCGCSHVILAHNHPGGKAYPSNQDIQFTRKLQNVLQLMGINLLDHFIVSQDDCVSMAGLGYLGIQRVSDKAFDPTF